MYLGLDLGTSGLKALLMDEDQAVLDTANASLSVSRPHPAWSEQAPRDWTDAATAAIDELRARRPREVAAVTGIGLSGQQHGATLLDAGDEVLRPCILWNDTRAAEEARALDTDPAFHRVAGNTCFAGFTAPKLNWAATHEPELRARVAKVLLPKDYLRLWLSGEHVSEMSDASGTGWLDIAKRDWSDELLALCDMTQEQMPRLVEGSEASAQLRPALAQRWGMTAASVVIAGGAGDNCAAAMGMGAVTPGVGFVSLGTSGVLFAVSDGFAPDPASAVHAFCHAMPGTWHQMGVILSATDSLNWLSGLLGEPAHTLTAALDGEQQRPGDVLFLPYLGGERTPINDPLARGAFVGLGHASDHAAMTRAVVEGVAFAVADSLLALRGTGTPLDRAAAVGGGTASAAWLQIIANATGLPVDVPAKGDFGAAFGAARLGLLAATGASIDAACTPPPVERTVEPEPDGVAAYASRHATYRALYPAIRDALRG